MEQFYFSDIILHQNGVVGEAALGVIGEDGLENVIREAGNGVISEAGLLADVEYKSSIVLLLTGVVREEGDTDKYLLSSELVNKLGRITRIGVEDTKWDACLPNLERHTYTSHLTLTMKGYKGVNQDVPGTYESVLSLSHDGVEDPVKDLAEAEMAKNLEEWRCATPSKFLRPATPTSHAYRSFNASPTGYRAASPPRGFRTVSSTPGSLPSLRSVSCSPFCKSLTLISWAHTPRVCPVCSLNQNLWQDTERHI